MRLVLVLPLLAAVVNARPQVQTSTSESSTEWKPVASETESQRLRAQNQTTRIYKTASNLALEESVQKLANQLTKTNRTTEFMSDTRTPPRIKFQQKNIERKKSEPAENSRPGVAIPVDVDEFYESTTTQKRPIIFRNENKTPIPDSGISTWILLSGQSTTLKPVRKQPTIKTTIMTSASTAALEPVVNKTTLTTEKPTKGTIKIKPLTTKKVKTTTPLPTAIKIAETSTTAVSTKKIPITEIPKTTEKKKENTQIVTKVKASLLNNAVKNKTVTVTTAVPSTTKTITTKQKTEKPVESEKLTKITASENTETNDLQPEAKDGALELSESSDATTKRPRRPSTNTTNKRKKNNTNKNRRRKPSNATASEKMDTAVTNSTKVGGSTKPSKGKPIGTQIYNYLSREIMPTVGVGLVGLVVTAGLASYFFYPFGGLRRTFDTASDRKDYYYDEYAAGGMAEEELIGKVIAGMPENEYSPNSYRTHLARKDAYKNDINYNYRNSDSYYPYPNTNDYQTISVGSKIGYGRDVIEEQKETGYTVDDGDPEKNQFVVGSIPKEFEPVTADAVPEHGPRSLRIRRYAQNDDENEIIGFNYYTNNMKYPSPTVQPYYVQKMSLSSDTTPSEKVETTERGEITTESTVLLQPEQPGFFSFLRNLVELKVRLGLDFLLKTTDTFSTYLRGVQERVNTVLKEEPSRPPPTR